ncbi:uncharacterized protein BDZ99DRAFT_469659 [Mytilinidion resinicola]|uniref:Uncharacterized protein n=1 Tax=Mytilinidion resinicola TaxID=574789 RepID=A0A6A6Y0D5_9PEZI|nr:uncharacterized protein BDZ99DRAFT_469659 [Mytilinidion resinicola]KAF2801474.1 hypothetical protein BDZ99DRAFT_469659 [Mytilinidion resinicola]
MVHSANCSTVPPSVPSDAGVAGAGVLLSFIITNFLALSLSAYLILRNLRSPLLSPIPRKLLLSFSDQQLLTGLGIQSVGLAKMNTMVPYHFFIIWMLSLLATATHLATLLALVQDFKRDWVLRWLRQLLMLVSMSLSVVMGVFVLKSVLHNLPPTLPIACVWDVPASKGSTSNAGLSIAGTIAVMAASAILFIISTWYLHNRNNQKWLKSIQVVGLILLAVMGVGAAVRVVLLSQAFGTPNLRLSDEGEKVWSFGQLLPLLLLLLPVVSSIELWRGEIRVGREAEEEEDRIPLTGKIGSEEFKPKDFQPLPLFGGYGK